MSAISLSSQNRFVKKRTPHDFTFIHQTVMTNQDLLQNFIMPRIEAVIDESEKFIDDRHMTHFFDAKIIQSKQEIETEVFSGNLILLYHNTNKLYSLPIAKPPSRSVEESNMEVSIRGPRDGFIEDVDVNVSLIRRRLKTSDLKVKSYTIGRRSQTKVNLLYMNSILSPPLLKEIDQRLQAIDIAVASSTYKIEEHLFDQTFSLVPLVEYSGRPDFVADVINEGRFAIVIDGSPSVIVAPTSIDLIFRSAEDSQISFFYTNIERLIRILSLITSILLPGFWLALTSYQIEQIPFPLVATIAESRLGLPLSSPMEVFLMLILFELFKEAGTRLPSAIGQTVAVIGGLIIGDAAIRAGLTSPATLVIGAVTTICSYTLTDQSLAGNILIIRFFIAVLAAVLGLYGFFIGLFLTLIYVISLTSFGHPVVSPFNKLNIKLFLSDLFIFPYTLGHSRKKEYRPQDPKE